MKVSYKNWEVPLDTDNKTLEEVYQMLPGHSQESISYWVRLLENPKSPLHLSGAVDLFQHDCIHLLLGRGLLPQDEAFVIGFTMGSAVKLKCYEVRVFELAARFLYPKEYRLTKTHMLSYKLGIKTARKYDVHDLGHYNFKENFKKTMGSIRKALNINISLLKDIYLEEAKLIPDSIESQRLVRRYSTSQ